MIEKIISDYLTSMLPVPAFPEEPENRPDRYVLVEKTGGSKENYINSATVAIQSYAESLYLAAELNEAVKTAMENIAQLDIICSTELNSDYRYTDVETKRYRYQAVYDITHY